MFKHMTEHMMKTNLDIVVTCEVCIYKREENYALVGINVWDKPIDDYGGTVFYNVPYERLDEVLALAEEWCVKQETTLSTWADHHNENFYPSFEGIEKSSTL